jgi:hypothetical protein
LLTSADGRSRGRVCRGNRPRRQLGFVAENVDGLQRVPEPFDCGIDVLVDFDEDGRGEPEAVRVSPGAFGRGAGGSDDVMDPVGGGREVTKTPSECWPAAAVVRGRGTPTRFSRMAGPPGTCWRRGRG